MLNISTRLTIEQVLYGKGAITRALSSRTDIFLFVAGILSLILSLPEWLERRKNTDGRGYLSNAWNRAKWIMPHEEHRRLGNTAKARCEACRELFRYHIDNRDIHKIKEAAHYCHPVGDDGFRQLIEEQYVIKPGQAKRGRPKKYRGR